MSKRLKWGERLALLDHYNVDEASACEVFGVTLDELQAARDMQKANPAEFPVRDDLDVDSYKGLFEDLPAATATTKPATASTSKSNTSKGSSRKTSTTTSVKKPESATKKTPTPKKRGRRGDKIQRAFKAIPRKPTNAEKFAEKHNVSIAVLRQSKRFDKIGGGRVRVVKDKSSDTLMIWREEQPSS